jgi:hypothetical protein
MLSELSSGEYRYPDLKFMVRIHHVTDRRIDGVGKGGNREDVLNGFLHRVFYFHLGAYPLESYYVLSARLPTQ